MYKLEHKLYVCVCAHMHVYIHSDMLQFASGGDKFPESVLSCHLRRSIDEAHIIRPACQHF